MLRSTTSGATEHRRRRLARCLLFAQAARRRGSRPGPDRRARHRRNSAQPAWPSSAPAPPRTRCGSSTAAGPPELPGRITAEIPGAVAAVSAFWGDDWPREIVVVTTGTDADFAAQTGEPGRDWTGVAAVAVADRVDPARREASGQRIVFAPGANSDERVGIANRVAPRAFSLRASRRHRAGRAALADRGRRRLRRTAARAASRAGRRARTAAVGSPSSTLPADRHRRPTTGRGGSRDSSPTTYGAPALRRLYVVGGDPQAALGVGWDDLLTRWQRWLAG